MALMFLVVLNATRVEAAQVNNLTPEQIEAVVTQVFEKFAAFDAEGTAALYAPDGTIEDPVGTPPVQGTQAIIAYLETFPTILNEIRVQSFDVTVAGQEPPSNGGYVSRPRLEMSFSWTASASLRSTRTEKFNRTESTLITRIFFRNCSNKHAALVARSGPPQLVAPRWPTPLRGY
jgi:hypothetical protein